MATLAGSDAFVVNRAGVNYQVTAANFMALVQDTDLFVVNRSNVNYRVSGLDVKAYFGGGGGSGLITYGAAANGNAGNTVTYGASTPVCYVNSTYYMGGISTTGGGFSPGNTQGYYTSTDGKNFSRVARGGNVWIAAFVVAPDGSFVGPGTSTPNSVGSSPVNIYRSTDGGSSWNQTLTTGEFYFTRFSLGFDSSNGKIGVAAGTSFYESSDNGATWTTTTLTGVTKAGFGSVNTVQNTPTQSVVGYGGKWYFCAYTGPFSRGLFSIPQGSSGSLAPTSINTGGTAAYMISLDVSRGLGSDFFLMGCDAAGTEFATFDTSFNLISNVAPVSGSFGLGNWVPSKNKMYAGKYASSAGGLGPSIYYTSTNGSLTDVSSNQTAQSAPFSFAYSVGTSVFTAAAGTPFTISIVG